MRTDDHRIGSEVFVRGNDIADRVGYRPQVEASQLICEQVRSLFLGKRRGRHQRDPDLIGFDWLLVSSEHIEGALQSRVGKHTLDQLAHYFTSMDTGSDSMAGFVVTNPTTRYVPGGTGFKLLSRWFHTTSYFQAPCGGIASLRRT